VQQHSRSNSESPKFKNRIGKSEMVQNRPFQIYLWGFWVFLGPFGVSGGSGLSQGLKKRSKSNLLTLFLASFWGLVGIVLTFGLLKAKSGDAPDSVGGLRPLDLGMIGSLVTGPTKNWSFLTLNGQFKVKAPVNGQVNFKLP